MVLLLAKKDDLGHSTKCVHIGGRADTAYGSLVTPIYQTTTYEIPSMADLIDINVHGTKKAHQYSSSSNPTQRAAELKIAALEGVEDALVFSGGMAAITSTILTYVEKGDEILAQKDLYSTTGRLFKEIDALAERGISLEGRIKVSMSAHLVIPYHKILEKSNEERRGGGAIRH